MSPFGTHQTTILIIRNDKVGCGNQMPVTVIHQYSTDQPFRQHPYCQIFWMHHLFNIIGKQKSKLDSELALSLLSEEKSQQMGMDSTIKNYVSQTASIKEKERSITV